MAAAGIGESWGWAPQHYLGIHEVDLKEIETAPNCCQKACAWFFRQCYGFPMRLDKLPKAQAQAHKISMEVLRALEENRSIDHRLSPSIVENLKKRYVEIYLEAGANPIKRIICAKLLVVESMGLQLIIGSPNNNTEKEGEGWKPWQPWNGKDLGLPYHVLDALKQKAKVEPNVAIFSSLGNAVFDRGHRGNNTWEAMPSFVVSDKGFTSMRGIAEETCTCSCYIGSCSACASCVNACAQCAECDIDTSPGMIDFARAKQADWDAKVLILKAKDDLFFNGRAAFPHDFGESIANKGVAVMEVNAWMLGMHTRAHHAATLSRMTMIDGGPEGPSSVRKYDADSRFQPAGNKNASQYIVSHLPREGVTIFLWAGAKETIETAFTGNGIDLLEAWGARCEESFEGTRGILDIR